MGYRALELVIQSAQGLRNVHNAPKLRKIKMNPFALVSIRDNNNNLYCSEEQTPIDLGGNTNPKWNFRVTFNIDITRVKENHLALVVKLKSRRITGDTDVGEVRVLITELEGFGDVNAVAERHVSKNVVNLDWTSQQGEGTLKFSYKFGNTVQHPPFSERRNAEHGSFTLRRLPRTPIRKQREVDDYKKKKIRQLEGYNEVKIMIETGCAPGNPAEDEMKPKRERMAILVTNIASIVLFALMVFASIESKSLSIIASILDPFFDLLWGFILWLTSHAMQKPNPHKYPIGKKRMQPVGMIVFGSFGLQLLFQAAKQFITKSEPEKDPQKEKWMIGIMTFVTMVQFMLAFYCRRFENKIVRAYAEHHSSNVKTNLISLAAAILAIRYYWWIDPTGAIIILFYTMNTWKKTFFENLSALIGRTAPPEFLAKLTYLIWNHHKDIEHIDTIRAYTFTSDQYFVEVDVVLLRRSSLRTTHAIRETLQMKLEEQPEVARAFVRIYSRYTHRAEHKTMV